MLATKDINFSRSIIEWRCEKGYREALKMIKRAPWLDPVSPDLGIVIHELPKD